MCGHHDVCLCQPEFSCACWSLQGHFGCSASSSHRFKQRSAPAWTSRVAARILSVSVSCSSRRLFSCWACYCSTDIMVSSVRSAGLGGCIPSSFIMCRNMERVRNANAGLSNRLNPSRQPTPGERLDSIRTPLTRRGCAHRSAAVRL